MKDQNDLRTNHSASHVQVASLQHEFASEVEARYMSYLTNVEEAGDGAVPEVPKITFLHKLVPGAIPCSKCKSKVVAFGISSKSMRQ